MSLNVIFKIVAVLLLMSVIVLVLPRILYLSCNCSMSIREHNQSPICQSRILSNESNVKKFSNIKRRIIEDRKLIEKTCARYLGSLDPWLPVKAPKNGPCGMCYYIDEDNKRGYCVNAKSGSSSIKFLLIQISGKFDQQAIKRMKYPEHHPYIHGYHNRVFRLSNNIANSIEPSKMLNAKLINEHIYSFSFVRHPYTRLVSAYEDRALGLSESGETLESVEGKTFPDFVDHVFEDCKHQSCNEHWEPQYMHCDYCDIRYDVIGRVESLEDDLEYIAEVNNFKSDLYRVKDDLHVHPTFKRKITIKENTEKVKRYFMQLNTTQLSNIYHMYKIDFEMFGYSTESYH